MNDPYQSGDGDSLVSEESYDSTIRGYLQAEQTFLRSLLPFSHLTEVGCMTGRYMDWCANAGVGYMGIDVVERYIKEAEQNLVSRKYDLQQFRLAQMDACYVHSLKLPEGALLFFPFNSFGNMRNHEAVVHSIMQSKRSFAICTYKDDDSSSDARRAYYERSGFTDLEMKATDTAIVFSSPNKGLQSVVYRPAYINAIFSGVGARISRTPLGSIGMAYHCQL